MVNAQLSEFGTVLLFIIGSILFLGITMTIAKFVRPNRPNIEKLSSYECGEDSVGSPWMNFNVRFYVVALLFVLFEVEILFLFPWGVVFADKTLIQETNGLWGWFSMIEMVVFILMLALGLVYAWVKGYLDWVKTEPEPGKFESKVPRRLYEEVNQKYQNSEAIN